MARRIAVASVVIGLGMALGACSSSRHAQYQQASWAGATPPAPVPRQQQSAYVAEPGDPIKEPPVEPQMRPNAAPDDPNEPFSPNYGGQRTRPPVHVSDAAPVVRNEDDQKPAEHRIPDASRAYFKRVTTTASAD